MDETPDPTLGHPAYDAVEDFLHDVPKDDPNSGTAQRLADQIAAGRQAARNKASQQVRAEHEAQLEMNSLTWTIEKERWAVRDASVGGTGFFGFDPDGSVSGRCRLFPSPRPPRTPWRRVDGARRIPPARPAGRPAKRRAAPGISPR